MKLITKQLSRSKYELSFNEIVLGWAEQDVDGFFYWWDNEELHGCTSSWVLRDIADYLDELNKPWEANIDNYFKNSQNTISSQDEI